MTNQKSRQEKAEEPVRYEKIVKWRLKKAPFLPAFSSGIISMAALTSFVKGDIWGGLVCIGIAALMIFIQVGETYGREVYWVRSRSRR